MLFVSSDLLRIISFVGMSLPNYKTKNCQIFILDNNVIQTTLNEGEIIELEDITEVLDICKRIARNKKHHSLMIPGENSNISGDARNYMLENVEWALSLSLVSNSLAHRILFDYSMRKLEDVPSKLHATTWQAHKWIEELNADK